MTSTDGPLGRVIKELVGVDPDGWSRIVTTFEVPDGTGWHRASPEEAAEIDRHLRDRNSTNVLAPDPEPYSAGGIPGALIKVVLDPDECVIAPRGRYLVCIRDHDCGRAPYPFRGDSS